MPILVPGAVEALVGLLGKLFSYAVRIEAAQLIADRRALTTSQARTRSKLHNLLDRSANETAALFHQVTSARAMEAANFFLEG